MQKITPFLWFDIQAKEAAEFYVAAFPHSKITSATTLHDTPSGDAGTVSFELSGYSFMAISAGPYFKLNPSVSFMLNFDPAQDETAQEHLQALWEKLSSGGKVLMPLQEYPFSKLYGWIQDTYGVTWQLMLTRPEGEERPFIIPSLLFTKELSGKAQEATDRYIAIFKDTKRGTVARYPAGSPAGLEGDIMFTDFQLEGQWFAAMDGGQAHEFVFSEAVSLVVTCDSQEEIDYYWEQLSEGGQAGQCGWLKDRFGVSWQIIPSNLPALIGNPKGMQAMLGMKKLDIAALEAAARD